MSAGAGFYVLSEEFGEDDLLGKEFGADGQVPFLIRAASAEETREKEKDNAEAQRTLSRRRGDEVHDGAREEFNTEFTHSGAPRSQRKEKKSNAEIECGEATQFLGDARPIPEGDRQG